MKNKLFTSIILTSILFASCTQNDISTSADIGEIDGKVLLTEEEAKSIGYDDPKELTETEVLGMITAFLDADPEKSSTRSVKSLKFEITSYGYVGGESASTRTEDGTPKIPVYEVLVDDGQSTSFVMASADERAPSILAYIPNIPANETDKEKAFSNPNTLAMIGMSRASLIKDIEDFEASRKFLRDKTIEKICEELEIPIEDYVYDEIADKIAVVGLEEAVRADPMYDIPPVQIYYWVRPMCKVEWHQEKPYNGKIPKGNVSLPPFNIPMYTNKPAGCAVIAMAQLESILNRTYLDGVYTNWAYLTANPTLFEAEPEQIEMGMKSDPPEKLLMGKNIVRKLYDLLGAYDSSFDANGNVVSTGVSPYKIEYYLNNYTIHTKMSNGLFNADAALASLNAGKPAYLHGNVYVKYFGETTSKIRGHAFILDGYMITAKQSTRSMPATRYLVQVYDVYWHVNLGWGEKSSAYFKLNSNATGTINFFDYKMRTTRIELEEQAAYFNIAKK